MGPKKEDNHRHFPPPRRGDSTKTMTDNEETSSQWTGSSSSVDDVVYPDMAHYLYALHKIAKHQYDDRDRESMHWQQRYNRSKQRHRELALQLAIERQRNATFLRRNRILRKKWRRIKQRSKRPSILLDPDDDSSTGTSFTPPQQDAKCWHSSDGEFDSIPVGLEEELSAMGRLPPPPTIRDTKSKPVKDNRLATSPKRQSSSDTSSESARNDLPFAPASPPIRRTHYLKAPVVEPRFDSAAHASAGPSRPAQQSTRNKPDDPSKDDAASIMQQSITTGTQSSPVLVSHSPSSTDTSSGSDYRRIYEIVQRVADAPRPPSRPQMAGSYPRATPSELASAILAASVLPRQPRRQQAPSPTMPSRQAPVMPPEATLPTHTIPSQRQATSSRSTQTSFHRSTPPNVSTHRPSRYTPSTEYTTRVTQTDNFTYRPNRYTPSTEYTTRATQTDPFSRPSAHNKPFSRRMPTQPRGKEFDLDISTQKEMLKAEITHRQIMQHWPITERQPKVLAPSGVFVPLVSYILY